MKVHRAGDTGGSSDERFRLLPCRTIKNFDKYLPPPQEPMQILCRLHRASLCQSEYLIEDDSFQKKHPINFQQAEVINNTLTQRPF